MSSIKKLRIGHGIIRLLVARSRINSNCKKIGDEITTLRNLSY